MRRTYTLFEKCVRNLNRFAFYSDSNGSNLIKQHFTPEDSS
jgi:hypothetical protein